MSPKLDKRNLSPISAHLSHTGSKIRLGHTPPSSKLTQLSLATKKILHKRGDARRQSGRGRVPLDRHLLCD